MKLFATSRSHFARKIRLLLDHLDLPYEMTDIGNVAEADPAVFHHNPAMSVPILEDGEVWLIDSDHIARYIAETYDKSDSYAVLTNDIVTLSARAVMNAAMANEVKVVVAARTGLAPDEHAYFQKAKASIALSLEWLEERAHLFTAKDLTYAHFHFISLWDHLKLYRTVGLDYPSLSTVAAELTKSDRIRQSAPPPH